MTSSIRGALLGVALLGGPAVALADSVGTRCAIDGLDAAQARARDEWARQCALTVNVGNPAAYISSTRAFDTSLQWAKDYLEVNPALNPSGVRAYSGNAEAWNVNYAYAWAMFESSPVYTVWQEASGPTAGYYKWSHTTPRQHPLYPIFGTSVDLGQGVQVFPHPQLADCQLYSRPEGGSPVTDFYVGAYCESGDTTRILNGIPLAGQSGGVAASKYYSLYVPPGVSQLVFEASGGTGDVSLYAQQGALPTVGAVATACRSTTSGNHELCTVNSPTSGVWYVMLYGEASYSGVSLVGRSCGNGVCESGEDSAYCASDCYCGDGVCSAPYEDAYGCAQDCSICGDGICQSQWGESSYNCPSDCGGGACGCFSSAMSMICPQRQDCPLESPVSLEKP